MLGKRQVSSAKYEMIWEQNEGFPRKKQTRMATRKGDSPPTKWPHVWFTQNKKPRTQDEEVGGLESVFSGPQRYEKHASGRHAKTSVEDYIGRPGQTKLVEQPDEICHWAFCCDHLVFLKSSFLLTLPFFPPDNTLFSSWQYLVFSRSSFLLMFAAARFDSSRFSSFTSTSGTETCIACYCKLKYLWKSHVIENHSIW